MMRGGPIALALFGALGGLGLGCLVELEHRIACGDGYVDLEAGEECDPMDEDSYKDACSEAQLGEGEAQCDPELCQIVVDRSICAKCGDGIHAIEVEQCDLVAPANAACGMGGQPTCNELCEISYESCLPYCGDGDPDPDEECDPDGAVGIATVVACTDREPNGLAKVSSAQGEAAPFGSGTTTCDASTCHWFRQGCSYCGNGTLEDSPTPKDPYNPGVLSLAEWCDGELFSQTALDAYYDGCSESQRPNVACAEPSADNPCRSFVDHSDGQPCCQLRNELYPGDDATLRCCWEYEYPGEVPWHSSGPNRLCN